MDKNELPKPLDLDLSDVTSLTDVARLEELLKKRRASLEEAEKKNAKSTINQLIETLGKEVIVSIAGELDLIPSIAELIANLSEEEKSKYLVKPKSDSVVTSSKASADESTKTKKPVGPLDLRKASNAEKIAKSFDAANPQSKEDVKKWAGDEAKTYKSEPQKIITVLVRKLKEETGATCQSVSAKIMGYMSKEDVRDIKRQGKNQKTINLE